MTKVEIAYEITKINPTGLSLMELQTMTKKELIELLEYLKNKN